MSDVQRRIASLDPLRRRLLEARMRREGMVSWAPNAVSRLPDAEHYALSFGQQRLWFIDQLIGGSPAYNIPFAGRLEGPLDIGILQRALNEVVRRHEILRTTFPAVGGRAVQQVAVEGRIPVMFDDLSAMPAPEREDASEKLILEEARHPFDLARGPVLRVRVARLEAGRHLLLVTMPHIVTDAWSMAVFFRDLPAIYDAYASGQPSPLPELPIQFRDYAAWQRDQLAGESLERLLGYWTRTLAGAPTVLDLPADRARPAAQTFAGARAPVELPRETTRALEAIAQREGATPFMAYLAAFAVLLHRWSGQDDLLIGSPVATRGPEETHGLIGFFINTLVFRTRLHGKPTFRALLRQARETCLEAYAHQDLPFERLVEALGLERDLSRAPLTQATLVLQNVHIPSPEFRDLRLVQFQQTGTLTAKFDLMLGLWESAEGVEGWWEYSTDLYEPGTIARLSERFRILLRGIVADPDRPIGDLPLVSEDEQAQIAAWVAPKASYPRHLGLKELFEAAASKNGDRVALSCGSQQTTYAELHRRANRLAHHLRRLGLGDEEPIGVLLPRSAGAVEAILGVVASGGAYVPLDPGHPPDHLKRLVSDTGCRWVVTDRAHEGLLRDAEVGTVCLDRDAALIAAEVSTDPAWRTHPEQLAYVMFTSGSTGVPKGIAVPNRAVSRLVFGQDYVPFGRDEVFLLLAPLAFDASTLELWGALLHGARLAIYPEETPTSALLREIVVRERVTTIWLTSGLFHLLVDEAPELFDALRRVVAGGDVLSPNHVRRALERRPGLVVVNGYGPTEATTFTCCHAMPSPDSVRAPVPIGRPLRNTRVLVLDEHGSPAPIAVSGELMIGGDGLARGYHGRPGWTAERFVPDPFGEEPGARIYRTGDRARWLPDGTIEFSGRRDRQVKVRGYRIELPEIEMGLTQHPAVRDAAVVAHPDERGGKRLVAYVVPAPGSAREAGPLLGVLRGRLPEFMIPGQVVFLDALPLTSNGKVDYRGLRPPPTTTSSDSKGSEARSECEAVLARIWAEALGVDRVGVDDDFFELGGDSIRAILVTARAHEAGLALTPRQLFENRTISALAAVASVPTVREAEQRAIVGSVPALPMQRWLFDQDLPNPSRWNMGVRVTVRGRLDPELLTRALEALMTHHDALRTRCRRIESAWNLELEAPGAPASLRVVDGGTSGAVEAVLEGVTAELHASLDVARGPILAAALVRGSDRDFLVIAIHHIAVDAVSWRVLLEDLERGYVQARDGSAISLPPKTASVRVWAERLGQYARSARARATLRAWAALEEGPGAPLPLDEPSAADREADAREVRAVLDRDATRRLLQEAPRAYRNEPHELLLASVAEVVAMRCGRRALRIDVERHGREPLFEDLDISRTVGWFTSIVPVLLDLREAADSGSVLRAVKEQVRAIPNGGIAWSAVRWLGEPEDTARLARIGPASVCFNYLGVVDPILKSTELFAEVREAGGSPRDRAARRAYRLEVTAWVHDGALHLAFVHGLGHRPETIDTLAAEVIAALRRLIDHATTPGVWGATPSDFPRARVSQRDLDRLLATIGVNGGRDDA